MEDDEYRALVAAGATSLAIYERARANGLNDIACIRLLRQLYGLSLIDAKRVLAAARDPTRTLEEQQGDLLPAIEAAFDERES